jgi:hypothetical protein
MEKVKSIYLLDSMGLNVPEILHYQGFPPTEADKAKLPFLLDSLEKNNDIKVSIRTEKPGQFKSPFRPNIDVSEARRFISELEGQGYSICVSRGVPTNSIVRGNCVPTSYTNYFEYLEGQGTVRDIDEGGRSPKSTRVVWGTYPTNTSKEVGSALQRVNSLLYPKRFDLGDKVVEFSVFRKPVGVRQDFAIFWEIRAYGGVARI